MNRWKIGEKGEHGTSSVATDVSNVEMVINQRDVSVESAGNSNAAEAWPENANGSSALQRNACWLLVITKSEIHSRVKCPLLTWARVSKCGYKRSNVKYWPFKSWHVHEYRNRHTFVSLNNGTPWTTAPPCKLLLNHFMGGCLSRQFFSRREREARWTDDGCLAMTARNYNDRGDRSIYRQQQCIAKNDWSSCAISTAALPSLILNAWSKR